MENNDNTPTDVVESDDNVTEPAPEPTEDSEEEAVDVEALKAEMESLKKDNEDLADKLAKKRITKRKSNQADSKKETQSDGLDYAQKAFLNTEGIKEFDFVEKQMKESGIHDVEKILANGYFQAQLKEHRDSVAVKEATPSGTRTDSKPSNTKVDYWIDKGELPPNDADNVKLRREVVNERIKRSKSGNNFSQQAIVDA